MIKNSARRWLAGLGVAGAFVAASATPAVAAEVPFEVVTHDLLVAPGHMTYGSFYAHWKNTESEPTFGRTTIDIDLSGVADFAVVEPAWGWACDVSPTKLHCEADLQDGDTPGFDYMVTGRDGAKPGQQGALSISVASGGKTATGKAGVTIAEGVDLVSDPTVEASGEPGARVGVPGVVRNAGETLVDGTVLVVQADWLAAYAGDFSNCLSEEFGVYAFCTFDTKLERGRTYELSEDLPIKLSPDARTGATLPVFLDWWTRDDWNQAFEDWLVGDLKPGRGGELRLVAKERSSVARSPQTDLDKLNNMTFAMIGVTGDNPADLKAVGATASGKKGDVVDVQPGFTNLGPAILEYQGQASQDISIDDLPVRISIPEGTTAVEAPWDCVPYVPGEEWDPWNANWGEPGAKEYACQVTETPKDTESVYYFGLRIDEVVPNAKGSVTTKLPGDPKADNDTAAIVINPVGGGTPGTPGDGDQGGDGGQGGGDDGDGPTLPITGSSTGLIAGVGALLLVAGVGGYVLARRRKTRFVA
ncbi:LPXTG cell wall anchor domain-containing protein [Micromonospora globbae]|uniref:LPXTG cell wall anchor domain-containing protein n=1 Tax=Micromonospora globbae TaxID=1894969 RepID=A0ABZ1S3V6_9ACTN|nr:LPXTG cell wall anchor domain-containing protein [Micromonospora globbae]WTF86484.1 LPXTG cell wall anchor domain-containing protein [Micromonospora globbae]